MSLKVTCIADLVLKAAIEGTRNILAQGHKLGVKHFSIVSSIVAVADVPTLVSGRKLTDKGV